MEYVEGISGENLGSYVSRHPAQFSFDYIVEMG